MTGWNAVSGSTCTLSRNGEREKPAEIDARSVSGPRRENFNVRRPTWSVMDWTVQTREGEAVFIKYFPRFGLFCVG